MKKSTKDQLMEMTRSNTALRATVTRMGKALKQYMGNKSSYDLTFDTQIRALRPDWFIKNITSDVAHDPAFEKKIRSLRPDWFRK